MSYAAHALSSASGRADHHRRDCSLGQEDEAVRVIKGLLLGCALSLTLWAAIGLVFLSKRAIAPVVVRAT